MGFYIETARPKNKAEDIITKYPGTKKVTVGELHSYVIGHLPKGRVVICVVDNGPFEAAAICFDQREFTDFAAPDGRPRTWLHMRPEDVLDACPYVKEYIENLEDTENG